MLYTFQGVYVVGNVSEGVRDGESTITEAGWDSGDGVEMGDCVGVLQDMCDKVAVVVVVIDVAVSVVCANR